MVSPDIVYDFGLEPPFFEKDQSFLMREAKKTNVSEKDGALKA